MPNGWAAHCILVDCDCYLWHSACSVQLIWIMRCAFMEACFVVCFDFRLELLLPIRYNTISDENNCLLSDLNEISSPHHSTLLFIFGVILNRLRTIVPCKSCACKSLKLVKKKTNGKHCVPPHSTINTCQPISCKVFKLILPFKVPLIPGWQTGNILSDRPRFAKCMTGWITRTAYIFFFC